MTRSTGRKVAIRPFTRVRVGLLSSTMLTAVALAGAVTPLLPGMAQAETWLGTVDSDYNNPLNWSGNIAPSFTATFVNNGAPTSLTITASGGIDLIEFDAGSPAYQITTGSNVGMTIQDITSLSGVAQNFTANNQSAIAVFGTVSGLVTFTAGSNSGSIEFFQGASVSEARFVGAGGILSLRDFNGETLDLGSIEGSGVIRLSNSTAGTLSVGGLNTDTAYSGTITSDLVLTKVGTGTLTLTGVSSYTGGTTFTGGAISVAADGALGDASGGLTFNGGTLETTASFTTNRTVDLQVPSSGENAISTATGTTLTVNGVVSGAGGLVKDGAGTLVLSGVNTYAGGTIISDGTVSISSDANLGAVAGLTFDGGTLQTTANASTARTILVLAGGGRFDPAAGTTMTVNSAISGTGRLMKTGAGTLTLTGANNYTAGTLVTEGVMTVSGPGSITHASQDLRVDGGTFNIAGGADVTNSSGVIATASDDVATMLVSGFGSTWTSQAALRVGFSGDATLTVSGGASIISANGVSGQFASIGDVAGSVGRMTVTGIGSSWVNSTDLLLGLRGTGTLTVEDEAGVTIEGYTALGSGTGGTGNGTLNLADVGTTYTTRGIYIGGEGIGSVSVLNGATLTSETVTVPTSLSGLSIFAAGSTGLVSGAGSRWDSDAWFYLNGSLTVADGGVVSVGATGFEEIVLSQSVAGGVLNIGAAAGLAAVAPGTLDVATVRSVSAGTLNFNHTGLSYNFSPVISGLVTVDAADGTTILSGTNTYTGGTIISGGTIQAGNNAALGPGDVDMTSADARLLPDGYQISIGGLNGVAGSAVHLGNSGTSVLSLTSASGSYSFAGNIVGGGVDPTNLAIVKDGASTQTLSGDNLFMGVLSVVEGTLVLASNTAMSGNSFLAVAADAQVTVNDGVDVAIAALDTSGTGGTVQLQGDSSLTVARDGVTNTFGGVITGTGAFIVDGTGLTQTLTGVSDYTGGTTIADGTLELTGAGSLASTGALDLTGANAVFDMSGVTGDRTIGDLSGATGSSVIIGAQGLTVGTANDTSFAGVISGIGGTLTKTGTGTLALTEDSVNTFTGLTTISGGGLQVDGSLAGALTAQSGGTLGGTGTITGAVTIEDGATLAPGASPGTLTVGDLTLTSGSILDFELGQAGVAGGALNDLVVVTNDLTLAGELNIAESAGGTFGLGTYTLFTYGNAVTFDDPLTLGAAPIGYNSGNFQVNATAGQVNLIVSAIATDQYWVGGTGTWDAVETNWTDEASTITGAWGGQTGIFRGTAGIVTVDGTQSFNALRFESDGYLLEGDALAIAGAQGDVRVDTGYTATIENVITGTGMLAKGGNGTLALTGANTYEGGTLIAGGILAISDDANLGAAAGGVTLDGGTLQLASLFDIATTRAFTIGAAGGGIDTGVVNLDITSISGTGTLVKTGSGTLSVDGTGNLAGGVSLLDGTLDLYLGSGSTFTGDIDGVFGTEVGLIAHGADGVYAGVISGDTGLYVGGAGIVTLSGINTFTDYTEVDTGATLALTGAGSIAASEHLDLFGTLDISGTSNGASIQSLGFDGTVRLGAQTLTLTNAGGLFNGTISGTGGVTLLAGVQGFAGTSTYSGATNVAADAFMIAITPNALSAASAFTVDGVLGAGADQAIGSLAGAGFVGLSDPSGTDPVEFTVGGNGTSTTFSGALVGEGTLIKTGAGTFTLTGDLSAFEGGFAVNGGDLAINTFFGGNLDVLAGGTLQGSGTVGSVDIASGATVAPGNSIGTLTVSGDASFSAGAIYQVEIDPTGASDLLAVGGVATLGGATVEVLKATGSYIAGTRYTILTAAGGVSGTFGALNQSLPFLDLALAYDATDVYLDIARNAVTFPSVGNTPNEIATGGAVETLGGGNALYNAVVTQTSVAGARAAFNALSGEIGASAKGVLVGDSQFIRSAVFERLVSAGGATPSGMAVAPLGYAAPTKPQKAGDVPYPTKAAPVAMAVPASALWAQGFGSWGSTDGNGNAASLDRDTGGFFIGADTRVGDWRLGVLGGYSQTSFDVDARASSGESDNIHAGLYAGTNWGAVNFRSGASYTWNDISTSRNVGIPTPQLLEADYDAGTAQVFGELGYGLSFGAVDFEPFAGLAYVNLHTDGFAETGGPAALASSSDSTDATYTTLGLRASTTFNTGAFTTTLRGMLGWRHAFGDITPTSVYQFAAGGSPFTVEGLPIAEDALVMDVGLDMALTDTASLGVFYSAQFGDSAEDQSLRGSLSWKF